MEKKNITEVVEQHLCLGCGVCENACPAQAICIEKTDGVYVPRVDAALCRPDKPCGLCYEVCPGREIATTAWARRLFPEAVEDRRLGRYLATYSGYSNDYLIRYRSASGGIVTALLSWLLETGRIEGALVTRFRETAPTEPEAFIARSPAEVFAARSSKYCPVSFPCVLREIERSEGRYAVVGLPCHLQGIRKLQARRPKLREKIAWQFGLYCSSTKRFGALDYLLQRAGVDPRGITRFAFRDEGCLGSMVVEREYREAYRRPFSHYYPELRSFFIPYRCSLCHDHCAELADLSVGDIHIPEFAGDQVGVNSLIVRSRQAAELLSEAVAAGVLTLDRLEPALLIQSQAAMLRRKKCHVPARLRMLRRLGLRTPQYDLEAPQTTAGELAGMLRSTLTLYLEMLIGKRRWAWPIIDACARGPQGND